MPAHRWIYEYERGPIEPGRDLDHLCRVRSCVNPDHLEPVTRQENLRRGIKPTPRRRESCYRGHPYTVANTYWSKSGTRVCRTCGAERAALRRQGTSTSLPPIQWPRRNKPQPDQLTARGRFFAKVGRTEGCWEWIGGRSNGYGSFWDGYRTLPAHRWLYEQENGPVAEGLVLDHLCRNRVCVNPEHLEEVTTGENTRRGPGSITHCARGHQLPERNGPGSRKCKKCAQTTWAAWSATPAARAKLKAQQARRAERNRLKPKGPDRSYRSRTHCPAGHPYPTASQPGKRRKCRPCEAERMRQKRATTKAQAA